MSYGPIIAFATIEIKHQCERVIFGPAKVCGATNRQAAPFTYPADFQTTSYFHAGVCSRSESLCALILKHEMLYNYVQWYKLSLKVHLGVTLLLLSSWGLQGAYYIVSQVGLLFGVCTPCARLSSMLFMTAYMPVVDFFSSFSDFFGHFDYRTRWIQPRMALQCPTQDFAYHCRWPRTYSMMERGDHHCPSFPSHRSS